MHTGELHVWRVEAGRLVAGVGGDGIRRRAVATGTLSERAPSVVGLSGGYCSTGSSPIRCTVCFLIIQTLLNFKIQHEGHPDVKIIETWHGVRVDPSKQLLSLGPPQILNRIQVIKLGTAPL
jgi:hypothetical protein